jgi:hypothetical protein
MKRKRIDEGKSMREVGQEETDERKGMRVGVMREKEVRTWWKRDGEDGKWEGDARGDEKGMRDWGRGTMGEGQWKREVILGKGWRVVISACLTTLGLIFFFTLKSTSPWI